MDTATHPHERHDFAPAPARPRAASQPRDRAIEEVESVVIRFVGDSGDGMQLTGDEFSKSVARAGHDFATHPDYPSEIRAPTGTLFGVSGYQIQFSSGQVFTSGDAPDVLVAMNPAALKTNLADVKRGGTIIANSGAFTGTNLDKAGYRSNPLEDGSLADFRTYTIDISGLTAEALQDTGLSKKEINRCKNYFALGLMLCLYSRPLESRRGGHPRQVCAQGTADRRRQPRRPARRLRVRRVDRDVRRDVSRACGRHRAWPVPQPHRQPRRGTRLRRCVRARGGAAVPRFLPDHAGHRDPARAVGAQAPQRHHLPGRGRDRRYLLGHRRLLRRHAGHDHHVRPGHGAQDRSAGARRDAGASVGGRRRATRRSLHRPADEDRAIRSVAGGLRPQRRMPAPGDRRPVPGRLLRLPPSRRSALR